jgi:hypothetical protein
MESAGRWGLDRLVRFGAADDPDMRPTLLRVLTELYIQKPTHTLDEERHYTELALRLLDGVDIGTRAAVAQRLARYTSPPRRVLERLAGDLTMLKDELGSRAVFAVETATILNELFFAADPDERRLILLNLDVIAPSPVGRMNLTREATLSRRLETAVVSDNREAFAQYLARALNISHAQARRLADDDQGESIVTAAKALNMRRGALYRILLFMNVGRSAAGLQALSELHHELPVQNAEHMVAIWQSLPKPDRTAERHQPMLWDDDSCATRPGTMSAITHHGLSLAERRDAS